MEQYSIKKFAESLEALPRALAENSGVKVNPTAYCLSNPVICAQYSSTYINNGPGGIMCVLKEIPPIITFSLWCCTTLFI